MSLAPGMTLADARAAVPGLNAVELDPDGDSRFLKRLAGWGDRFTPLVALDGRDGLILDVTGCAALFGGESALRRTTLRQLKGFGFSAKAALAGTPEAAAALARFGRVAIVEAGDDEAATAPLPIAALGVAEETLRALRRAGLRTVGDLAVRPSSALSARFGASLVRQLARVCGWEDKRLTPLRPLPQCQADRRFPEPLVHADVLEDVLRDLLDEAMRELGRRGEGGLLFEVSFFRADGEVRRIAVETGRPSRDTVLIKKLFAERMAVLADPIDPGFGFDAMRLGVLTTAPLKAVQDDLEKKPGDGALGDLVDRLVARFGPDRVQRFVPEDTHMPERAVRRVTALKQGGGAAWPLPDADEPPVRPLHMFDPPHAIDVPAAEFPDGPPRRFRWRRVSHDVLAAEGPERIAPEWWRDGEETLTRDYYRVEDREGRRFWIYRRGLYERGSAEPAWFLHGLFA